MNKFLEWALDIVGGTEIGEQVTDLKDNVMDTVWLKTETKEALADAGLDQVASTYEALAAKVGITDQKDLITKFIVKGRDKDKFAELHTKIKSLAQKWWADVSNLDGVLTTHELTGGSKIGYTVANAVGKIIPFVRKTLEKINVIHSPKDLGKMVFAINEITTKVDVSKLDEKEENKEQQKTQNLISELDNRDWSIEWLKWIMMMPLVGGKAVLTWELWDDRGDHKHQWNDYALEWNKLWDIVAPITMEIKKVAFQDDGAWWYVVAQTQTQGKTIEMKFMHLAEEPENKVGDIINQWVIFAKEWSTGWDYKPHLHFELRINGKIEDPKEALAA